uniref:Uncharacterized protein n=1 Tax=Rhizophagus irregularis (strain DAOM 181602 / DAOM 197198 / MUCL 43194) TaxID=747089 RepID=U9TCQ5_RHIID
MTNKILGLDVTLDLFIKREFESKKSELKNFAEFVEKFVTVVIVAIEFVEEIEIVAIEFVEEIEIVAIEFVEEIAPEFETIAIEFVEECAIELVEKLEISGQYAVERGKFVE